MIVLFLLVPCLSGMAKEKLHVLYVGSATNYDMHRGEATDSTELKASITERTGQFASFLKKQFTKVTVVEGNKYSPEMSARVDVTVFDGSPHPIRERVLELTPRYEIARSVPAAFLPDDFPYPVLCIGETSSAIGKSIGTKNDWYCLCLRNYAFGYDKGHPIFKGPFKVKYEGEMRPVPTPAATSAKELGQEVPEALEMVKIYDIPQNGKYPYKVGIVSRPGGYLDSPDAEFISSGVSDKGLDAVAIGRHGNFFHWGFAASPAHMTTLGKALLANAIVYASKFGSDPVIARKFNDNIAVRSDIDRRIARASQRGVDARNEGEMNFYNKFKTIYDRVQAAKASGQELSTEDKRYENLHEPSKPHLITYDEYIREVEPELYEVFGEDPDEYLRYFTKNRPYFHPDETGYNLEIDHDCRSLGIANNDVRLLDRAVEMLGEGGRARQTGKRLLERYTLCRFESPAEWKDWIDTNRDRLFFTEAGGWLWLVDSKDRNTVGNDYSVLGKIPGETKMKGYEEYKAKQAEEAKKASREMEVATLHPTSRENPVALAAVLETNADGSKEIVVKMNVHQDFHTYAAVDDDDPYVATTFKWNFADGVEAAGDLISPVAHPTYNNTTHYVGKNEFRRKVKGTGEVEVSVRYQACDANGCHRPKTEKFKVTVK